MRTVPRLWTGLACVALWASFAVAQDGKSALTAIRYAQQTGGSRLTLQFAGEFRYAISRDDDRIILSFPGTVLTNSTGARRLQFMDGLVRSVAPRSIGGDSIVVVIALKAGTTSTVMRPSEGNALLIDVARDPNPPPITSRPAMVAAPPRRERSEPRPGLVDIPALARSQVEEKRRTADTATQAPAALVSDPAAARGGERQFSDVMMIAAAVLVSVGSTLGLLFLLRRRAAKSAGARLVLPAPATEATGLPAESAMDSPLAVGEHQEETEQLFDDRVQMAKIFQRGKEEVNLAMALRARALPKANKKRLAQVVQKSGSSSQRRTAARKLGVGVGEVELAVHLKNMQNKSKRKEGAR